MPLPRLIHPEVYVRVLIEYLVSETPLTETTLLLVSVLLLAVILGGMWLLHQYLPEPENGHPERRG